MIPLVAKNTKAWRIQVTFAGNLPPRHYLTPDIRNHDPGWGSELFQRTIERIEFFFPTRHLLVLTGMAAYNFFVEAVQSKKTRGMAAIRAFWFCGLLPGKKLVETWRIGDNWAVHDQKPWGKEYGGGPTRGWKPGVPGDPVASIFKE